MTNVGREIAKALEPVVQALERSAKANEDLLTLATQEQIVMAEPGPPVCPFCGRLDPEVTQVAADGDGPLGDFVMAAEAHCCNKVLYAVPLGFDTFTRIEMAQDALTQRKGG